MQTAIVAQQQTTQTLPTTQGIMTTNPLQPMQRKQNPIQFNMTGNNSLKSPLPDNAINNQVIQKKLIRPDKTEITKPNEINDTEKAPGPEVEGLITAANKYYLPSEKQDFTAKQIKVLEEKKYILGEDHGDGQWQQRVTGWDHIPKVLEKLKGFTPESPDHKAAIETSNFSQTGTTEMVDNSLSYPLEDRHPYALTRFLLLQQQLNDYTNPKITAMLDETLKECYTVMNSYAAVGLAWSNRKKEDNERQRFFLEAGLLRANDPAWDILADIHADKKLTNSLNDKEVQAIQKTAEKIITALLELIDKRPLEGIFWKTRQGNDPISNRKSILDLSKSVKGRSAQDESLFQGNSLRNKAMVENIKSLAPPLLVQTGDHHVFQFIMDIGNTVAVYKVDKFDNMLLKP